MLKTVLVVLAFAGLHAAPLGDDVVAPPRGEALMRDHLAPVHAPAHASVQLLRPGTEPSRRYLTDLTSGLVKDYISEMDRRVGEREFETVLHPEEPERTRLDKDPGHFDDSSQRDVAIATRPGGGWVRDVLSPVQKSTPVELHRQGTEPSRRYLMDQKSGLVKEYISEMERRVGETYVPPSTDQFRQGTQNSQAVVVDIRTGLQIEPVGEMRRSFVLNKQVLSRESPIPAEPKHMDEVEVKSPEQTKAQRPEFLRQGAEPSRRYLMDQKSGLVKEYISEMDRRVGETYVPPSTDRFRQGTQNSRATVVNPKTGQVMEQLGEMDRGLALSNAENHRAEATCKGEVISDLCYHFNPSPQSFDDAESTCKELSPRGHLAAVTSADLHSRLVSMVTKSNKGPVLTWLGGTVQNNLNQWLDGSPWGYSDWMPGHPIGQGDGKVCLEMFKIDESWWTTVDCDLIRASICSYPLAP